MEVLQFEISWRAYMVSDDWPFVAAFKQETDRQKNIYSIVQLLFYTLELLSTKWKEMISPQT